MRHRLPRIDPGLELAIRKMATMSALAEQLGLTVQSVSQWTRVPVERVLQVENLTGVSRYMLRPDIYGPEPRRPLGRRPRADRMVAA